MEFYQFHPTSLFHPDANSFLISEAVRGAGGILRNKAGERFMESYHPLGDLAPRDIVARAIDAQLKETGEPCVFLDISHQSRDEILSHFPTIYETCLKFDIDITKQAIPVVPAAHYQCGGVMVDAKARTTIDGLFACGEVTYTGLHGANRLASNSLLEALVFSHHAALSSIEYSRSVTLSAPEGQYSIAEKPIVSAEEIDELRLQLRQLMWQEVSILRSNKRLLSAQQKLGTLRQKVERLYEISQCEVYLCELRNLCHVSDLMIKSALKRQESRGLHTLRDVPETRNSFLNPTIVE